MGRTIRLNFCNLVSYFGFHPKDKRLSPKDQKIAKAAAIISKVVFPIYLFCRIFLYKKTLSEAAKPAAKKTSEVKNRQFASTYKPAPADHSSPLTPTLSSVIPEKGPSTIISSLFNIKDLIDAPRLSPGPIALLSDQLPVGNPCRTPSNFLQKVSPSTSAALSEEFNAIKLVDLASMNAKDFLPYVQNEKQAIELMVQINARWKQWDEAIQITNRITSLPHTDHLCHLTIGDLQLDIQDSALKVALCSPEELQSIQLKEYFSDGQIQMICHRWHTIEPDYIPVGSISNCGDLTFQQFKGQDSNFIMDHWASMYTKFELLESFSLAIAVLTNEQIAGLDFTKLDLNDKNSVRVFYYFCDLHFEKLSAVQIMSMWSFFFSKEYLQRISPEILKQLDFNKCPPSKTQFDHLFPVLNLNNVVAERSQSLIQHLTRKQIMKCLHHFDGIRMSYLSDSQVKELPEGRFDIAEPKDLERFQGIFRSDALSADEGQRRMALLNKDQLLSYWPVLDESTIQLLSSDQMQDIDFTMYSLSKELFDARYPTYSNLKNPSEEIKLSKIKELRKEQIEQLWEHFEDYQTRYLSEKQLKKMDFAKLLYVISPKNPRRINGIFENSTGDVEISRQRFSKIPAQSLIHIWPFLEREVYVFVTKEQLKETGTKLPLRKKDFDLLFPADGTNKEKIQALLPAQIAHFWEFFDGDRMNLLSTDQIKGLDCSKFKTKSPENEDRFNGLFKDLLKIEHLNRQQLLDCWDLFEEDHIVSLYATQIPLIDEKFDFQKKHFDWLFPSVDKQFSGIKYLNKDQIERFFLFFDEERIQHLDEKQLEKLDPTLFDSEHGKRLKKALFP